ncbi:MAG: glycosyl hydrolase [Bacteroidia bacterium]|nr:MAG: glycosyl hydrolase [Bacteroidia bacterium]
MIHLSRTGFSLLPLVFALAVLFSPVETSAQKKKNQEKEKVEGIDSKLLSGMKWRSIGPALTSGRVADFAVNPDKQSEWYVAIASGNVWKTVNNGTTFQPVFDKYGSYSTGVITMDPNNPNLLWLGTGENNHQRALGYGDGVYKSEDGGESWKNMGLKESRQIGGIVVDPRNSNVVFVAAEGSVWGPGGERGLYKSTDGGENWKKVLEISENTGVNNVVMDPVDPEVIYATSEQRRRHVFTKIGGGPESAVYRSVDGGERWDTIMKGLPKVHIGGMGIDVSPADRNVVYLIMEAAEGKGGFFRSENRGASWKKMSDYHSSGQYYNEIYCDPVDVNKVYSMETVSKVTVDGGKTWNSISTENRHVDDHALWIDPRDTKHFLIGGDGGVYESFDGGLTFLYKSNLPVTQFYRVNVDNEEPFYNVYGGTQDNNTLGGPSMNKSTVGVSNEDWEAIKGGDGFWAAVDPIDHNIVYCESQYGNVSRYDRLSGEGISIKPWPRKGEDTYKWNWNAPMIVSQHSHTRIYMMANKVFRSDDRGNSWEVISEDLGSGVDRNTWPVMDQFWSWDAVVKDVSTSLWGTGVSISESRIDENLLYTGTDDGVISVTENGGKNWSKVYSFPGVPEYTYVSDLLTDRFDANVVYATFDNHKRDDFKPYVLKSYDKGNSWVNISANLPENGTVHTIEQDPEVPGLLFVGTEFGFYFSLDGGGVWTKFSSGLPTIAVRDMVIQEDKNDLVLATFGRGFYILDDYTPLRELAINQAVMEKTAHIFPVSDALMYIQSGGKYGQGSTFFSSKNPDFGATFTYFLKDVPKTLKAERQEKEKELFENKQPIPQPTRDQLRLEESEESPYLVFAIRDASGEGIRKLYTKASKGLNRINWDLRYSSTRPVSAVAEKSEKMESSSSGTLAMPGTYSVELYLVARGEASQLVEPVPFKAKLLKQATLPAKNPKAVAEFQAEVSELSRVMSGTRQMAREQQIKLNTFRKVMKETPGTGANMLIDVLALQDELGQIIYKLEGPSATASWEELSPMEMPLNRRLNVMVRTHWSSTSDLTKTETDQLEILREEFPPLQEELKRIVAKISEIDGKLEELKAPWTPGRIPELD